MAAKHQLLPLTRETVEKLLQETQHPLTLADLAGVYELNDLARRVSEPDEAAEVDLLNLPVPCGHVVLRKLTMGKAKWFEDGPLRWWSAGDDEGLLNAALGLVLSLPNSPDALDMLATEPDARAAVVRFWKSLTCTEDDYYKALIRAHPPLDDPGGDKHLYGPTVALLVREYGQSPRYWFFEEHIDVARAMLAEYAAKIEAEHRAARKGRASRGGKGRPPPPALPPATPSMWALKAFREKRNELRKLWSEDHIVVGGEE